MLILALLFFLVNTQLLKKTSDCMDSCQYCPNNQPIKCIANLNLSPCQEGFSYNKTTQKCVLRPTFESQYSRLQLTEHRSSSRQDLITSDWNKGKITQCFYTNGKGVTKYFDAIGMFKQIHSISKQYQVSQHHQIYLFSFNLLRSLSTLRNDFLIIDVEAGNQKIASHQISYQVRDQAKTGHIINCKNQKVITEKYNIKVHPKTNKTNKIKITFTGFLFTSLWGITNIKLIPGCQKFSIFNKLTGGCDFCDMGYFPINQRVSLISKNQLIKCIKCPFQCNNCLNQTFCRSCIKGYKLLTNFTCIQDLNYTKIQIKEVLDSQTKYCESLNQTFFINKSKKLIETSQIKKQDKKGFGNGFLSFEFYYNKEFYLQNGKLDIKFNGIKISQLSRENLTNKGFESCQKGGLQRYSVQKVSMFVGNVSQFLKLKFQSLSNCERCGYGVSSLRFFYERKQQLIDQLKFNGENFRKVEGQNVVIVSIIKEIEEIKSGIKDLEESKLDEYQTKIIENTSNTTQTVVNPHEQINQETTIQETQQEIVNEQIDQEIMSKVQNNMKESQNKTLVINQQTTEKQNNIQSTAPRTQKQTSNQIALKSQNQSHQLPIQIQKTIQQINQQIQSPDQSQELKPIHNEPNLNSQNLQLSITQQKNQQILTSVVHQQPNQQQPPIQTQQQNPPSNTLNINQPQNQQTQKHPSLLHQIDHFAFSRQGINGLIIKLNKNIIPHDLKDSNLVIELSSTTKTQLLPHQTQHIQLKSKSHSSQTVLTHFDSQQTSQNHIYAFYTDKTYLRDKVTIYTLNNSIKTKIAQFQLQRTDFLVNQTQNLLSYFYQLFNSLSWFIFVLLFIAIFTAKVYLLQQTIQTMQLMLMTVYIFTSYLPASMSNTVLGLKRLENLNFLPDSLLGLIQRFLLGDLIQQSPLRLILIHKDINFIRGFIPIFFLLIIALIWFLLVLLIDKRVNKAPNEDDQQEFDDNAIQYGAQLSSWNFYQWFNTEVVKKIARNKLDYWMQILKLLFLSIIFLSFKQFNNFKYPQNHNGELFNILITSAAFLFTLLSSITVVFICTKKYYKLEYHTFLQSFPSIYYKTIPKNRLPTENHLKFNPLLKVSKIFMFCFLVGLAGNHPILIFVLMIFMNVGEIFFVWMHDIYQDSLHFKLLIVESILLTLMLLIQMIISCIASVIQTDGYMAFGYVQMSLALAIILNGFGRSGYLIIDYIRKQSVGNQRQKAVATSRIV